jgi:hypothetical protein
VPYLLPWVRILLLIRSITLTTWGHEAWTQVRCCAASSCRSVDALQTPDARHSAPLASRMHARPSISGSSQLPGGLGVERHELRRCTWGTTFSRHLEALQEGADR